MFILLDNSLKGSLLLTQWSYYHVSSLVAYGRPAQGVFFDLNVEGASTKPSFDPRSSMEFLFILINPLMGNAPPCALLLCLTPDNFTRQEKSLGR
jgi:hypothetical protein